MKKGKDMLYFIKQLVFSIYSYRKVIIPDSGFCVLHGLLELSNIGLFPSALIKIYRPKYFSGNIMYDDMSPKEVGGIDIFHGYTENIIYDLL